MPVSKMTQAAKAALTPRGRRLAKKREPQLVEAPRLGLFIKGTSVSQIIKDALKDMYTLKRPFAKQMSNKNAIHPFEDAGSLEFFAKMNDAGAFVFGSHSKKRPHTLTFGRFFDDQILDMMEFQIDPVTFMTMNQLSSQRESIVRPNSKPLFVFQGDAFDTNSSLKTFRSLILDVYRGEETQQISLMGIDRVFVLTAAIEPVFQKVKVFFRHYGIVKKRSGTRVPRVELEEVGPRMDMTLNRFSQAPKDVVDESMRVPKQVQAQKSKKKNIEEGLFGTTLGRIHMQRQNFKDIALAKLKGLGKGRIARRDDENAEPSLGDRRSHPVGRFIPDGGRDLSGESALQENRDRSMTQSTKRVKKISSAYAGSVTLE